MDGTPRRGRIRHLVGLALACVAIAVLQGALIVALVALGSSPPAAIAGALLVTGAACMLVGELVVLRRRGRLQRGAGRPDPRDAAAERTDRVLK